MDRGDCGAGTVLYTANQTDGVGRYSKVWKSNVGDFALTMILKPHRIEYEQLAYVTALAVGAAVLSYNPMMDLQYKWVNDVMISGKKVAGILLEKYQHDLLLVGIGINILPKSDVEGINAIGLSELGIKADYKALLQALLQKLTDIYISWEQFGFANIRQQWLDRAFRLNEEIKVNLPDNQSIDGVFRTIKIDGRMQLEKANGEIVLISAGEVFF